MMYLILLTILLPLVLGVYLYFRKIENRNLKNIIIASVIGLVVIINILLTFFTGRFNLFKFSNHLFRYVLSFLKNVAVEILQSVFPASACM